MLNKQEFYTSISICSRGIVFFFPSHPCRPGSAQPGPLSPPDPDLLIKLTFSKKNSWVLFSNNRNSELRRGQGLRLKTRSDLCRSACSCCPSSQQSDYLRCRPTAAAVPMRLSPCSLQDARTSAVKSLDFFHKGSIFNSKITRAIAVPKS